MKKILLLMAFCLSASLNAGAQDANLRFRNGKFKILQLTDIHWQKSEQYRAEDDSTVALVRYLIKEEKPDLVMITGDMILSGGKSEWIKFTRPMVEAGTPFAVVFGNHDAEAGISEKEAMKILRGIKYNITYDASEKVSGEGNCIFDIKSSDGRSNKWILYLFNSHSEVAPRDSSFGYYDWVHFDQIKWYREQSAARLARNGHLLPALAFLHIPFPEYETLKGKSVKIGNDDEAVCCPTMNSGLFVSFLEAGDVIGVFAGHDHNNDYLLDVQGRICLAYGRKTGYVPAYKEVLPRGGRVIVLDENSRSFHTYIIDMNGRHFPYDFKVK
ncbi:MAG: metallophosphoesterase family protein [Bacteroidales bacterium]|nr:metallophosphoesterase family protein [Bacteroidales bacterium]